MSRSVSRLRPLLVKSLCIVSAVTILQGCQPLTRPSQDRSLIPLSCPPLVPLTDDSFGATTLKLIEVAGQYHKCRAAALASQPK